MAMRRNDIDWLRILAVLLLFDFHTAMILNPYEFYVKNDPASEVAAAFVDFVHQWHMPLLFLLSGMSTYYALGFRTGRRYLKERFKRLFVPLVFGTLVIVPPQVYFWLRGKDAAYPKSYLAFYPDFFDGIRPNGNFEWGHLWFLAYLIVFSLLALPVFLYLRKEAGSRLVAKLAAICDRPGGLFLLVIPLGIVEAVFRPRWPGLQNLVDDWANFFSYLLYFGYGYLLCSHERFGRAVERHLKLATAVAVVATSAYIGLGALGVHVERGYSWDFMLMMFGLAINTWAWLLMFLALGRRFLTFGGPLLLYAREAAYPVYILHQTAIVWIGFYVVQWPCGAFAKFVVIDLCAFGATMVVYDLCVRRAGVTRFLFGMRPRKGRP